MIIWINVGQSRLQIRIITTFQDIQGKSCSPNTIRSLRHVSRRKSSWFDGLGRKRTAISTFIMNMGNMGKSMGVTAGPGLLVALKGTSPSATVGPASACRTPLGWHHVQRDELVNLANLNKNSNFKTDLN